MEDEVVGGLKKLGLDPATIKYVLVSHGHSDHSGGAKYLQDRFNARVMISAADWDLLDRSTNGTKPTRDMVATDGLKLTLGDTTLTLYLTPGHTLGTISTLIPVKDRRHAARRRTGAAPRSTGWRTARPTSRRSGPIASGSRPTSIPRAASSEHRRGAGADVIAVEPHRLRRIQSEAAGACATQAGRSASVRDRPGGVQRYLTVVDECAQAGLARVGAQ